MYAKGLGQCLAIAGALRHVRSESAVCPAPCAQSQAWGQHGVSPHAPSSFPPCSILSSQTGPGPQRRGRGEPPALLEDPKQEGDIEEGGLGAPPHPSASLDGENRGSRTRDPIILPLPGPLFVEGLASAALEDGECFVGPAISPWSPVAWPALSWQTSPPSACSKALSQLCLRRDAERRV